MDVRGDAGLICASLMMLFSDGLCEPSEKRCGCAEPKNGDAQAMPRMWNNETWSLTSEELG